MGMEFLKMYKKHTLYTFQSEEACPHCSSTKILSFEVEENEKQIHVVRCEDCGIENTAVYDLQNEYMHEEPEGGTYYEPGYTRVKEVKRPRKFESVRKSEDQIFQGA